MISAVSLLLASQAGAAPALDLHLVPSGTFRRVGGYQPFEIAIGSTAPPGVSGLPGGSQYGSLKLGAGRNQRRYLLAIEEPVSAESRIYVDSHGDGKLTESAPVGWKAHTRKAADGSERTFYDASITLDVPYMGSAVPCVVVVYPSRPNKLGYYADFSLQGTVSLKGVKYDCTYWDSSATWDPESASGTLMIDSDHDGKFHPAYEFFSPKQPFNIKGTTYELKRLTEGLAVVKSAKSVRERTLADLPADPNLSNGLRLGTAAPIFSATTLAGQPVNFPHSYAGKVVMLDFWATWCGPCMREAPNVAAVYAKYHDQGLEILGVSLDDPHAETAIAKTVARVGMTWPQIYQGKGWESVLVKQYGIKAIPATYLVDGDSGKIIAMLDQLRGPHLEDTVKRALAAKHN